MTKLLHLGVKLLMVSILAVRTELKFNKSKTYLSNMVCQLFSRIEFALALPARE